MNKPTQQNVVKIKQDIAKKNLELASIVESIKSSRAELADLELKKKTAQSVISSVWEKFTQDMLRFQSLKVKAQAEIEELTGEIKRLQHDHGIILEATNEAREVAEELASSLHQTFPEKLLEHIKMELEDISSRRDRGQQTLTEMASLRDTMDRNLLDLRGNLFADKEELKKVAEEYDYLKAQTQQLSAEIVKAKKTLEEIAKRDHDSRVMAMRLTEEYKQVYFNRELRNKKI